MFWRSKVSFGFSLAAILSLCFAGLSQAATENKSMDQDALEPLNPLGVMPSSYYKNQRLFRYPIPTKFEFAYIDKSGKVVVRGPLFRAHDFSFGVAVVETGMYVPDGDKWKCDELNADFAAYVLIAPDGHMTRLFHKTPPKKFLADLAAMSISSAAPSASPNKYELVDKVGKVVTKNKWDFANEYSDGLVSVSGQAILDDSKYPVFCSGYQDQSGKQVIPLRYFEAGPFSEGLAAVTTKERSFPARNLDVTSAKYNHPEDYCYINKSGQVVIAGPYMEARPFVNGTAAVMVDGKWGHIDKSGKQIVPCQYDWVGDFTGKFAPVEQDLMVGYVDKTGKTVIPFKFKDAREFGEGLAPATVDARKWGYIDESGQFVVEPKFKRAYPFNSGRALVYLDARDRFVPEPADAGFMLISAQRFYMRNLLNQARAACLNVVAIDKSGVYAKVAAAMLQNALPPHDLSKEAAELYKHGIELAQSDDLKQVVEAEKLYRKALSLDPDCFNIAGALAHVLIKQNRPEQAIAHLQPLLRKYPNYARGHYRLSQAYSALGQKDNAESSLKTSRSIVSGDPDNRSFEIAPYSN